MDHVETRVSGAWKEKARTLHQPLEEEAEEHCWETTEEEEEEEFGFCLWRFCEHRELSENDRTSLPLGFS